MKSWKLLNNPEKKIKKQAIASKNKLEKMKNTNSLFDKNAVALHPSDSSKNEGGMPIAPESINKNIIL